MVQIVSGGVTPPVTQPQGGASAPGKGALAKRLRKTRSQPILAKAQSSRRKLTAGKPTHNVKINKSAGQMNGTPSSLPPLRHRAPVSQPLWDMTDVQSESSRPRIDPLPLEPAGIPTTESRLVIGGDAHQTPGKNQVGSSKPRIDPLDLKPAGISTNTSQAAMGSQRRKKSAWRVASSPVNMAFENGLRKPMPKTIIGRQLEAVWNDGTRKRGAALREMTVKEKTARAEYALENDEKRSQWLVRENQGLVQKLPAFNPSAPAKYHRTAFFVPAESKAGQQKNETAPIMFDAKSPVSPQSSLGDEGFFSAPIKSVRVSDADSSSAETGVKRKRTRGARDAGYARRLSSHSGPVSAPEQIRSSDARTLAFDSTFKSESSVSFGERFNLQRKSAGQAEPGTVSSVNKSFTQKLPGVTGSVTDSGGSGRRARSDGARSARDARAEYVNNTPLRSRAASVSSEHSATSVNTDGDSSALENYFNVFLKDRRDPIERLNPDLILGLNSQASSRSISAQPRQQQQQAQAQAAKPEKVRDNRAGHVNGTPLQSRAALVSSEQTNFSFQGGLSVENLKLHDANTGHNATAFDNDGGSSWSENSVGEWLGNVPPDNSVAGSRSSSRSSSDFETFSPVAKPSPISAQAKQAQPQAPVKVQPQPQLQPQVKAQPQQPQPHPSTVSPVKASAIQKKGGEAQWVFQYGRWMKNSTFKEMTANEHQVEINELARIKREVVKGTDVRVTPAPEKIHAEKSVRDLIKIWNDRGILIRSLEAPAKKQ